MLMPYNSQKTLITDDNGLWKSFCMIGGFCMKAEKNEYYTIIVERLVSQSAGSDF